MKVQILRYILYNKKVKFYNDYVSQFAVKLWGVEVTLPNKLCFEMDNIIQCGIYISNLMSFNQNHASTHLVKMVIPNRSGSTVFLSVKKSRFQLCKYIGIFLGEIYLTVWTTTACHIHPGWQGLAMASGPTDLHKTSTHGTTSKSLDSCMSPLNPTRCGEREDTYPSLPVCLGL